MEPPTLCWHSCIAPSLVQVNPTKKRGNTGLFFKAINMVYHYLTNTLSELYLHLFFPQYQSYLQRKGNVHWKGREKISASSSKLSSTCSLIPLFASLLQKLVCRPVRKEKGTAKLAPEDLNPTETLLWLSASLDNSLGVSYPQNHAFFLSLVSKTFDHTLLYCCLKYEGIPTFSEKQKTE